MARLVRGGPKVTWRPGEGPLQAEGRARAGRCFVRVPGRGDVERPARHAAPLRGHARPALVRHRPRDAEGAGDREAAGRRRRRAWRAHLGGDPGRGHAARPPAGSRRPRSPARRSPCRPSRFRTRSRWLPSPATWDAGAPRQPLAPVSVRIETLDLLEGWPAQAVLGWMAESRPDRPARQVERRDRPGAGAGTPAQGRRRAPQRRRVRLHRRERRRARPAREARQAPTRSGPRAPSG